MHNEILLSPGFYYIGGSDRRIHLFENVYPLENGVSYNSYLYLDEKTLVLDTVDASVSEVYYENIEFLLQGRKLDYLIVNHMEPDHAANIGELLLRHPETKIVISPMAKKFLLNYFPNIQAEFMVVSEGDKLSIGKHEFTFVSAPMVHWPEVMMTYELTEKVLFSADAFGTFGALNGDIYASPKNFDIAEARRYYTNIVGKYGDQVVAVLKKAATIEINLICPLHGPLHRGNLNPLLGYYQNWATYTPDDPDGVMIAYSSVYGHTANTAEILASKIAAKGCRNIVVYDVSKTDSSVLIAEAFRVKTIVLAATTYNAGVFVKMEDFLHDLANHKLRYRNIAFIENGSWAPAAKSNMKRILDGLEGFRYLEETLTIASALKENQLPMLEKIAEAVVASIRPAEKKAEDSASLVDAAAMFKLSYGLFALVTKGKDGRDNASINNSFFQVSDKPNLVMLSVNVANLSADTIRETGVFNVSVLDESADFGTFKRFGFQSGRDANKFAGIEDQVARSENGLYYLKEQSNAFLSCKVVETIEAGNHVLFIAEVTEAKVLNQIPSVTYAYYFANIKPKPMPVPPKADSSAPKKIGWRCKICGYVYEGEVLPPDYVCPLCKHPATDFEKVEL
ncbi:MAG: flavin reductase [Bacilli bacterium]|nr:flavin reductase [Bacilli bacterium]